MPEIKNKPTEDPAQSQHLETLSSKLLLSILQKENDLEVDSKKTIETRSGVLMGFVGVILVFFLNNFNFTILNKIQSHFIYTIIFIISLLFPLISFGFTFYYFIKAIDTREYLRIDLTTKNLDKLSKEKEEKLALDLSIVYQNSLKQTIIANHSKKNLFKKGVYSIFVNFTLLLISFLLLNIISTI
ncbi:hypothetical protein AYJ08_05975 [Brevibacillus sp. SKDU10]|uniref:hypothetical protein n=1 Tax=Brevibacillus sp. SKDU10 TaxID=1247872 RepID=UPI0007C90024|nr:hypothetical protein [Brevibacillus sp. SKDU10]OAJ75161.1 hypothetical protein AYJ08_05975 [Brevibacillus sp. SKDU10]